MPKVAYRSIAVLSLLLWFAQCAPSSHDFQNFEPERTVRLDQLFNETPVLREMFAGLDPATLNRKLYELTSLNPGLSVGILLALSQISGGKNYALPDIMDVAARAVQSAHRHYGGREAELSSALSALSRITDLDPNAVSGGVDVLSDLFAHLGNDNHLYPGYQVPFPPKAVWSDCSEAALYESYVAAVDTPDESRATLLSLYDTLRVVNCLFSELHRYTAEGNRTVPGSFAKSIFKTLSEATDIEQRAASLSARLRNQSEIDSLKDFERDLADWLILTQASDSARKNRMVDFLIQDAYRLLKLKILYPDQEEPQYLIEAGKPLLDLEAHHLARKIPWDNSTYIAEWWLGAATEDFSKWDRMELFTPINTDPVENPLHAFARDLLAHGPSNVASAPTWNLQKNLLAYDSNPDGRLLGIFWDGLTYHGTGGSTQFRGLLCSKDTAGDCDSSQPGNQDGYLVSMARVTSNQNYRNLYREQKNTELAPLMLGVNSTYQGEAMLTAILSNMYYYLLSQYYYTPYKKWAFTSSDAQSYFGNREQNLLGYLGGLQYTLYNLAYLNPCGKAPGVNCNLRRDINNDGDFADANETVPGSHSYHYTPYITALLYTLGAANGYVNKNSAAAGGAPATLTLRDSLYSMGANDIAADGIRTISIWSILNINIQVACNPPNPCATNTIWRNGENYSTNLNMFDFELISPGRFLSRNGNAINGWRGVFTGEQGDIETTKMKTANWIMAEISLNAWQGFGPFTFKGRAPNGSALKYRHTYLTDRYQTAIDYCTGEFLGFCTGYATTRNAMGQNGGIHDGNNTSGTLNGHGNYRIYQKIYRPMKPGDPCWSKSEPVGNQYVRYGYVRRSADTSYHLMTEAYICPNPDGSGGLDRIQVDFDSMEEAIQENFNWLMNDKKYVFVIPMYGYADTLGQGASFSVYATINANGIAGIANARRAGLTPTHNGRWNSNRSLNMMGAGSDGYIPNSGFGFVSESPAEGANKTIRYGRTSFEPGDSAVILDITVKKWGGFTSVLLDLMQALWDSLGDGMVTPVLLGDNFTPIFALSGAVYEATDLLGAASPTLEHVCKFKTFYDTYFPGNDFCLNTTTLNTAYKAEELPPVPRVPGIRYPASYAADGSVATWYTYNGKAEGKFGRFIVPLVMTIGTIHEDGVLMLDTGTPASGPYSIDDFYPNPQNETPAIRLQSLCQSRDMQHNCTSSGGFRDHIDTLLDTLILLNESVKSAAANTPEGNLPDYQPNRLTNRLVDGGTLGARSGFLPKLFGNRYLNVAHLKPLREDLGKMIAANIRSILDSFTSTEGMIPEVYAGETLFAKDLFRYLTTAKIKQSHPNNFPVNGFEPLISQGESAEPLHMVKKFLGYLRSTASHQEVKTALKNAIPVLNDYFEMQGLTTRLNLSDNDIEDFIGFLNARNSEGDYTLDSLIDFMIENNLTDIDRLRNFTFDEFDIDSDNFGNKMDDLNNKLRDYFDVDFKRDLLYNPLVLGEPTCTGVDGSYGYYDHNKNGKWDAGIMQFTEYTTGSYTERDLTAGTNGLICSSINVPVPNIYNWHAWHLKIGRFVNSFNENLIALRRDRVRLAIRYFYTMNFDTTVRRLKDSMLADLLDRTLMTEPYFDRNDNGSIEAGEFTDLNGNGKWDYTARDYANKTALKNLVDASPHIVQLMAANYAARFIDANNNGLYDSGELYYDENGNLRDPAVDGPRPVGDMELWYVVAEPFTDANHNGRFDSGENYIDTNGDNSFTCSRGEPFRDLNTNGAFDSGEPFLDFNANGVRDSGGSCANSGEPVTLRRYIGYYTLQARARYLDAESKGLVKATFTALDKLFNPHCTGAGCNYLSQRLVQAWNDFNQYGDISAEELNSLREFAGSLLYDSQQQNYTYVLSQAGRSLPPVLDEFSTILYRNGRNNDVMDFLSAGFEPDGALTYITSKLSLPPAYNEAQLFEDIFQLMNTRNMRCYPGKLTDLTGQPITYCHGLQPNDTFWGQTSQLLRDMALNAYTRRQLFGGPTSRLVWSESCNYYYDFARVFREHNVKWYSEADNMAIITDCSRVPTP